MVDYTQDDFERFLKSVMDFFVKMQYSRKNQYNIRLFEETIKK